VVGYGCECFGECVVMGLVGLFGVQIRMSWVWLVTVVVMVFRLCRASVVNGMGTGLAFAVWVMIG